ncbi:MAG: hypothetical protein ACC657_17740 [Thiohalomonadales bacterium]
MTILPDKAQQIRQTHAPLIIQVVKACQNPQERPALQAMLDFATQQNWHELVIAIDAIIEGQREMSITNNIDEEDKVIITAILQGLQNPSTLPKPTEANPAMAAPGIAHMIYAANKGDVQALQSLSMMAEQMTNASGDMRLLGGNIKRLIDGERDLDVLCKNMSINGEKLMVNLINELATLAEQ